MNNCITFIGLNCYLLLIEICLVLSSSWAQICQMLYQLSLKEILSEQGLIQGSNVTSARHTLSITYLLGNSFLFLEDTLWLKAKSL